MIKYSSQSFYLLTVISFKYFAYTCTRNINFTCTIFNTSDIIVDLDFIYQVEDFLKTFMRIRSRKHKQTGWINKKIELSLHEPIILCMSFSIEKKLLCARVVYVHVIIFCLIKNMLKCGLKLFPSGSVIYKKLSCEPVYKIFWLFLPFLCETCLCHLKGMF